MSNVLSNDIQFYQSRGDHRDVGREDAAWSWFPVNSLNHNHLGRDPVTLRFTATPRAGTFGAVGFKPAVQSQDPDPSNTRRQAAWLKSSDLSQLHRLMFPSEI